MVEQIIDQIQQTLVLVIDQLYSHRKSRTPFYQFFFYHFSPPFISVIIILSQISTLSRKKEKNTKPIF
jgi:hypothetical protein